MNAFPQILENINVFLFQLINAPSVISTGMLCIGIFFASYAIAFFPIILISNWLWSEEMQKKTTLYAFLSMLLALIINIGISVIWQHPRPFVIPIGQHFLYHIANNSFPSDHVSLACAVSFSLIACGNRKRQGLALLVLSIMIAWARIYMGVHFPLDMAASICVALISVILSLQCTKIVNTTYSYVYPYYHSLFSIRIRKGMIK